MSVRRHPKEPYKSRIKGLSAVGGNGEFGANIVVMSTLLGIITVTGGLLALRAFALL